MKPLRRHQLAWLDEYAWFRVMARASAPMDPSQAPDPQVLECLEHWALQRWPLVVTRQAVEPVGCCSEQELALGLPTPARWGRRPISVSASALGVVRQGEFPLATEVGAALPAAAHAGWVLLCEQFARLGVQARVYGSYGWQQLTGLVYVHACSDVDLLLDVSSPSQADQVCALLSAAATGPLRLDGELAFGDGASVAWREWLRLRAGLTDRILVKRIAGTSLEDAMAWMAPI